MTPVLEIGGLTMRFGMVTVAEGISVALQPGELVGLIGPNGAGKTTFLNLITGYLKPQQGSIGFLGRNLLGLRPYEVTRLGIGRSFQIPQLFPTLTLLENALVALAAAGGHGHAAWRPLKQPASVEAANAILRQFGLGDQAGRRAGELPEGGRKLLDVALAFALRPRLLLMDEPTSGFSAADKLAVMDTLVRALREGGVTALFVEHDMEVVRRYAQRVLAFSHGQVIADGPPDAVLSDPEIRRAVAGWG